MPAANRSILIHGLSAAKKTVSRIMDHIIISAENPALRPDSRVMYFAVIRPVTTLLYRAGELLRKRPAESSTKGVLGTPGGRIPMSPEQGRLFRLI